MRYQDNGSFHSVSVSEREVDNFNRRWPCSTLEGPQWFQFDKCNGDLVDRTGEGDGDEALALAADAQKYAERKAKLVTI